MSVYNLFRCKGCKALCCAVPEDFIVPGFLSSTRWHFMGRIEIGASSAPTGFDKVAAKIVIPLNGFYLFQEAF